MFFSINYRICIRTDLNSCCFTDRVWKTRTAWLRGRGGKFTGRLEGCAGVHLEFGFSQSFQGEPVVREVRASARVYTSQGGWKRIEGAEGVSVGNFVLVLARNFGPPSYVSPCPPSVPSRVFVPLNKLVRFNDSYFFLVTRLPSFAPTRRLRKVVVNLVPSTFSTPLSFSLSISAAGDHRDSGLTTVGSPASIFFRWWNR